MGEIRRRFQRGNEDHLSAPDRSRTAAMQWGLQFAKCVSGSWTSNEDLESRSGASCLPCLTPKLEKESRQFVRKNMRGFCFRLTAELKFQLPGSPPPNKIYSPSVSNPSQSSPLVSHYEEKKISKGIPAKLLHAMQGVPACIFLCYMSFCSVQKWKAGRENLSGSIGCLHFVLVLCFGASVGDRL
jgi:hypothetical protein